jgi:putative ABC transport system substrate-binding protein
MRRREFIGLIGGAAAAWPLTVRAQKPATPVIGVVGLAVGGPGVAAFRTRLGELGWIDGRNVTVLYRAAEGRPESIGEYLAEFVRLKVDIIVTGGNVVRAAMQATSTIPIVFAVAVDPVGSGFVTSLARPGGNVTGFSLQSTDLVSKRLELIRKIVPGVKRLAVLGNVGYPAALGEMRDVQATAAALGIEVVRIEIRRAEDIAAALGGIASDVQALYVCTDALVSSNIARINELSLSAKRPTICGVREYLEGGGLLSYGPSFADLYRRSAELVDKILHGAKPADLPVEQPTKFEMIINLKSAKTLGIDLPPTLLATADDVIE